MKFRDLNIDLSKLTKAQKLSLLKELELTLKNDSDPKSELSEADVQYETKVSKSKIEKMILEDFARYDEVFKALA